MYLYFSSNLSLKFSESDRTPLSVKKNKNVETKLKPTLGKKFKYDPIIKKSITKMIYFPLIFKA